ncbi:DUF1648 domain-containing protein [Aciduricibacillus chroicocephali]|uniref:DUF1648 domain-containing protein n=1 Tax=Aciduricibacillus chroicocephali TaxID=3054939 RepID=A0ABY9KSH4_9BACI|nr:DUF1648 domain-containing protein [Bacillaceae bacterium 44XB]
MSEKKYTKTRLSLFEKVLNGVALVILLTVCISLFIIWREVPDKIPIHFNIAGEADGWGGKGSLFILILIGMITWIGITILEKFPEAHKFPVEVTEENREPLVRNSVLMLNIIKNLTVIYLCYATWEAVRSAIGKPLHIAPFDLVIYLGLLFASMGYLIYKMYKLR